MHNTRSDYPIDYLEALSQLAAQGHVILSSATARLSSWQNKPGGGLASGKMDQRSSHTSSKTTRTSLTKRLGPRRSQTDYAELMA